MGCGSSREVTIRSSRPRSDSGTSTPTITIDTRSPSRRPSSHKRRSNRYSGTTYTDTLSSPRVSHITIRDERPSPTRPIPLQPIITRSPSHRRHVTHGAHPSIEARFNAANPPVVDRSPTTARQSIEERFRAANPRIDSRIPAAHRARTSRPLSWDAPPPAPEPPVSVANRPPRDSHVRAVSTSNIPATSHHLVDPTARSDPTPRAAARSPPSRGRSRSRARAPPRAPPASPSIVPGALAASPGRTITRRLTYRVGDSDHLSAVLQGGGGPSTDAGSRRGRGRDDRGEAVRRRSRAPSRAREGQRERERSQDGLYKDYGFPGHTRRFWG